MDLCVLPFAPQVSTDSSDASYPSSSSSSSKDSSSDDGGSEMAALENHMSLLKARAGRDEMKSAAFNAPIFTNDALRHAELNKSDDDGVDDAFSQYGLLAGDMETYSKGGGDPRVFYNVAVPSSTFICGSQDSGKSHSLSCILENALIPSKANVLPEPLTGIVFHYDTFISDTGGSPCEAAFLSSSLDVSVRVLCAPTNIAQIKRIYSSLPNVSVEELRINEADLNTKRMLDLMAVNPNGEGLPLYMHVIMRILRDLRTEQQLTKRPFAYGKFKQMIASETLKEGQLAPLQQRLETLESFMTKSHANSFELFEKGYVIKDDRPAAPGTRWEPKPGQLTVVDLSCPCVTAEMACSLFGICLSLFLEQKSLIGRIVALDEAHKYMTDSAECQALTESLLSTIRLQRHLGARVVISTQEPTISPRLLDLCSVTLVHRFTSPDWLDALKRHLAGASSWPSDMDRAGADEELDCSRGVQPLKLSQQQIAAQLFHHIVHLHPGEALLFCPSAVISADNKNAESNNVGQTKMVMLGRGILKVRVRQRVTRDGGRSITAGGAW